MADNRIIECMERAQYILGNLMAVKPGEEVLIVTDPQTDERMTQAMAAAANNLGAEWGVYMMPIRGKDKATIFPKSLELGMDACDVFVGMTTASGAAILTGTGTGPRITWALPGKIADLGVTDTNNMGAAMAPAACDTLCALFADTGTGPDDYDRIVTGDLGLVGHRLLRELLAREGIDPGDRLDDCGMMLFRRREEDVHAGGSGCGCSAGVLCGHLLGELAAGRLHRMIFAGTGALLSPTSAMQGESIPGICHAVVIEAGEGRSEGWNI